MADGKAFVSTAYEGACDVALKPDGAAITWKAADNYPKAPEKLPTLMTTLLHRDGHLYGMDVDGKLRCLKADTGDEVWEDHALLEGKKTLFGTVFWVWNGARCSPRPTSVTCSCSSCRRSGCRCWARRTSSTPPSRPAGGKWCGRTRRSPASAW